MRAARAARRRAFSLLEVMVAMAILAGALTVVAVTVSRSLSSSNHARLMTTATFLCRQQIVHLEEKFIVDGFTDDGLANESDCDLTYNDEPRFRGFRCTKKIEKITLPSVDQIQSAASKVIQDKQSSLPGSAGASPPPGGADKNAGGAAGAATGAMGSMLGPVKEMLEQGIRRVTVKVLWDEPGRPGQEVEVVTFYTDMRRIQI